MSFTCVAAGRIGYAVFWSRKWWFWHTIGRHAGILWHGGIRDAIGGAKTYRVAIQWIKAPLHVQQIRRFDFFQRSESFHGVSWEKCAPPFYRQWGSHLDDQSGGQDDFLIAEEYSSPGCWGEKIKHGGAEKCTEDLRGRCLCGPLFLRASVFGFSPALSIPRMEPGAAVAARLGFWRLGQMRRLKR